MADLSAAPRGPRAVLTCVMIGLLAGLLSGLFGVGGGTVVVPLLVATMAFNQRLSAGTSLAAIIPTATVGVISYAAHDAVAWLPAVLLACGAVVGALLGTWLSARISTAILSWLFIGFLFVVIMSLFLAVPDRNATLILSLASGAALVGVGLASGVLSGLLGVGGGIIVVPAMILLFGTSDLIARGTSLLMMIPAATSGTVGNLRRQCVDLPAAAWVGVAACATAPLGTWLTTILDPFTGTIMFAAFLLCIAVQMILRTIRTPRGD